MTVAKGGPVRGAGVKLDVLLRAGSNGPAVAAVQRALGVTTTGHFGPLTRAAVIRFQRAQGLEADGIVGPRTGAALGMEVAATATPASALSPAAVAATLRRIAACESNGVATAVSRDGRYRGKYQFSRSTWRAMGGSGDPAAAPEAEQDRRAAALLGRSGTAPWPRCA